MVLPKVYFVVVNDQPGEELEVDETPQDKNRKGGRP